jgi:hypothetical protein
MSIDMSKGIISDMGILSSVAYEEYGGNCRIFLGAEIFSDKDGQYTLFLVTPLRGVTFSLALCAIHNMADQSPAPSFPVFRGSVVIT